MRESAIQRDPKTVSHESLASKEVEVNCTGYANVPICRVMRLLQRIAYASMGSCKDPVTFPFHCRRIKLHCHQLIHVPHQEHVTVELNDPIVLSEPECGQLCPAVTKSWIVAESCAAARRRWAKWHFRIARRSSAARASSGSPSVYSTMRG